jgi:hypothetical protein
MFSKGLLKMFDVMLNKFIFLHKFFIVLQALEYEMKFPNVLFLILLSTAYLNSFNEFSQKITDEKLV